LIDNSINHDVSKQTKTRTIDEYGGGPYET